MDQVREPLQIAIRLCWHHHRLVHEGGWGIKPDDNGTFEAIKPDGTKINEHNRDNEITHGHAIEQLNKLNGLGIDSDTCIPNVPSLNGALTQRLADALEMATLDLLSEEDEEWITASEKRALSSNAVETWKERLAYLENRGVQLISICDEDYPTNLRMISR